MKNGGKVLLKTLEKSVKKFVKKSIKGENVSRLEKKINNKITNLADEGGGAAKGVHGNSKLSKKAQHGYAINNKKTGEITDYGISGQKLNKNGTSPRVNQKLRTKYDNNPNYESIVLEPNLGNRKNALDWELNTVKQHKLNTGAALIRQLRPKID